MFASLLQMISIRRACVQLQYWDSYSLFISVKQVPEVCQNAETKTADFEHTSPLPRYSFSGMLCCQVMQIIDTRSIIWQVRYFYALCKQNDLLLWLAPHYGVSMTKWSAQVCSENDMTATRGQVLADVLHLTPVATNTFVYNFWNFKLYRWYLLKDFKDVFLAVVV